MAGVGARLEVTVRGHARDEQRLDARSFQDAIQSHVRYSLGKRWHELTRHELFMAVALAVRDRLVDRMLATEERYEQRGAKRLYYLSMEFLIGTSLGNNLRNLGLYEACNAAVAQLGTSLQELEDAEADAALGNGGLGRLAACFLDSLATLGMPGFGYGINYEYGLFKQVIDRDGQHEQPDAWRSLGTPWLIERPDLAVTVPVYGRLVREPGPDGAPRSRWVEARHLVGVPHDMPIVGYAGQTVNHLRLYSARASDEFDIQTFNRGDYVKAVEQKIATETISKVLYPPAHSDAGKELRLLQEYFFVACALRDIVGRHLREHRDFDAFPSRVAIQLNDTHPALAVAELVRALVDDHGLPFQLAFELTRNTLAYTNHTLLPEALEKWSLPLLARVLPRHLELIEEINHRFLEQVAARWPGDVERLRRVSIIEEGWPKQVRMAHLAIVGSHSVNGVAKLHSELVKRVLVPDFHELWPERFSNKTNGITPRRWLLHANPGLARLVTSRIGDGWILDLDRLRDLEPQLDDPELRASFRAVKRSNKEALARVVREATGVTVDPGSLYDVHVKRLHEYKRQLLAAMHVIHRYLSIVEDGRLPDTPRTFVFAGKAAPDYAMAKLILRLIHGVAATVNADPAVEGLLRVAFVPDYRVALAERIIPAADLSEQISTAGMEASGTSNMKFALNGALTIGTLDGANIEILEAVGEENLYIFGLRAEEVRALREERSYHPRAIYEADPLVRRVMDAIGCGRFSPEEPDRFRPIFESVVENGDPYFHLADLGSYLETQDRAGRDFREFDRWSRRALSNVARIGGFSSDRTIREYAEGIWSLKRVG